jgi:uncharacterized membrane protein
MTAAADRLVDDYLRRLRSELAGLPRARRRELEAEISEHIAEARTDLPAESEAEVRTMLDRLGDPADIAAEARERWGFRRRTAGWQEVGALVLLLIGGVVLPVVGWFVGVVLLWLSDAWNARDKVIGTLVIPGGLLLPLGLLLFAGSSESCVETSTGFRECTGGGTSWIGAAIVIVLFLAPFATTIYLARRRSRLAEAS